MLAPEHKGVAKTPPAATAPTTASNFRGYHEK
jgi:hypothetical protein